MTAYFLDDELPKVKDNCLREIAELRGKWMVDIKKPNRTLAQNRYWHDMCGDIASDTGQSLDYIKCSLKRSCGFYTQFVIDGEIVTETWSSANLNIKQMKDLIDATLLLGESLGIKLKDASIYGL